MPKAWLEGLGWGLVRPFPVLRRGAHGAEGGLGLTQVTSAETGAGSLAARPGFRGPGPDQPLFPARDLVEGPGRRRWWFLGVPLAKEGSGSRRGPSSGDKELG